MRMRRRLVRPPAADAPACSLGSLPLPPPTKSPSPPPRRAVSWCQKSIPVWLRLTVIDGFRQSVDDKSEPIWSKLIWSEIAENETVWSFFSKLNRHIFTFDENFYITDHSVGMRLRIHTLSSESSWICIGNIINLNQRIQFQNKIGNSEVLLCE